MIPQRVLIVEDSLTAALSLRFELEAQGIPELHHVTTIAAACAHLRGHDCDLVMLDLLLPDASGLEGLRAIQTLRPEVAIVILTGTDDRAVALEALDQGAQDYLVKGDGGALILRTLSFALQRNHSRRTIETMSAQLRQANDELKRANDLKDQFVGMAAHDLRSPLGVIRGMAELLEKRAGHKLDDQQVDLLNRISRASSGMLRLVEDLLDLVSIESGQLRLCRQQTNVSALVTALLAASRQLADQKDIEIVFEDTPTPVHASLDPQRYEQVLDNLVANAIKYSNRQATVTVRLEQRGDNFVTTVSDRGQGISADEQVKLFKPFARTSAVPTAGEKSTGLGLTIVKTLVEQHGGTVSVTSAPGQGSSFTVELPLQCADG